MLSVLIIARLLFDNSEQPKTILTLATVRILESLAYRYLPVEFSNFW
jgi:hypothetical protein